ncbi:MAG: DotU family type IV/VI secretion system protein [Desulfobulbaceae bacterium]|nr:DotU family type IV/VI secretion system protein [Desulfobulbaceae bacterium]
MRLRDCFAELIAYVAYFLKSGAASSQSFGQVQADVQRLLAESESMMRDGAIAAEDYNEARFAVCAWVDEALLSSNWSGKNQWQKDSLQRKYFQTSDAGEEFFDRLNRLGQQQRDAREIYYLCLAMGFKGRYHQDGDRPLLEQLKTSNLKFLLGSSVGLPALDRTELFPEAYPVEGTELASSGKSFFTPATLAALLAPVALFGTLFLIYSFILSNIGENFLKSVP